MIDKEHLRNKQVAFRLLNSNRVNIGVVLHAENDGFWIDSPHLVGELQQDLGWGQTVTQIQTPVLFVPTSSLMFLLATQE
ncbi:MAG: hypothetical protein DMG74_15975 [Acidobacteria bacterium]|nr:MAG: hypothetical protein DMG74_15975 [Acidobacteriota bacterium]